MTYHRPLFTGNVLKVRLSCEKNLKKTGGKNQQKNHGKGKKNQDWVWIHTPAIISNSNFFRTFFICFANSQVESPYREYHLVSLVSEKMTGDLKNNFLFSGEILGIETGE